ncbi:MAG: metallophosphatase family protein [Actinobacteria bacterium]|nr:metallophosphatase family protein [Actinomycetota bacterium]
MRVAAIADVHGNLPALEAVLAEIDTEAPDLVVICGDVAWGCQGAETLDRLRELSVPLRFVLGNCDRDLVRAFDEASCPDEEGPSEQPGRKTRRKLAPSFGAELTLWEAARLTRAQRDAFAGFERTVSVEVTGLGSVLFCHGSPRDEDEMITEATSEGRLAPMLDGVDELVVVFGHTHMQVDRVAFGHRLVNPGSVGLPYEDGPGAYWALLGPDVMLRRTPYDVEQAVAALMASGCPDADDLAAMLRDTPSRAEAIDRFEQVS